MPVQYCSNCGNQLAEDASFCTNCGNLISGQGNRPDADGRGRSTKKWLGIGCGGLAGLLLLLIIIGAVAGGGTNDGGREDIASQPTPDTPESISAPTHTPTPAATPTPNLSELPFAELKVRAVRISYDDLFRNNESHVAEIVYYEGEVIQVVEAGSNRYQLRANVTEGEYFWDDTVFLHYSGPRVLEDDIIEFVGRVEGLLTYEAVLGNKVTIPEIRIIQARLVKKGSER